MSTAHPVQVETSWRRMLSVVDEAATTLVRASFSSAIRDFLDFACAIFDAKGTMLVQSTQSTPGLLGILPFAVPNIMSEYPTDALRPGDVVVTNDPWLASGHLIDITVVEPVFAAGERVAGYVACSAHHLNVGGRLATIESRDMYEEGLKIPPMQLYRQGQPVQAVFELLRSNVREPDKVVGDLRAQVSANALMAGRVKSLLATSDHPQLETLATEISSRSESSMRQAVGDLPNGEASSEINLAVPGLTDPVAIKLSLAIRDREIVLDYTGTSEQVPRAVNVTLNMTRSYSFYILKALLDPLVPNNEGCLRAVKVLAPEGSVLNARRPASTWGRTMIAHMLPELIMDALSSIAPQRVIAPSGSTPLAYCNLVGERQDGSTFFAIIPMHGGMGAQDGRDGLSCISFPANCANIPAEITESDSPVLVRRKALLPDSGGPGKYRGGLGQRVEVEVLKGELGPRGSILAGIRGGRLGLPIEGVSGGKGSISPKMHLEGEPVDPGTQVMLSPGDTLSFDLPGGGGYGDPCDRASQALAEDLKNGLVSDSAIPVYRDLPTESRKLPELGMTGEIRKPD